MGMAGNHLFEYEQEAEEAYLNGDVKVEELMLEKGNRYPKSESIQEIPPYEPNWYLFRYPNGFW